MGRVGSHTKAQQRTVPGKQEGTERKAELCWEQQGQGRALSRAVTPGAAEPPGWGDPRGAARAGSLRAQP